MVVLQLIILFMSVTFLQFLALLPLKKLNLQILLLMLLSPGFTLITSSLTYVLDTLIPFNFKYDLVVFFLIALIIEFSSLNFFSDRSQKNIKFYPVDTAISSIRVYEILILLTILTCYFIIFLYFNTSEKILYASGDGVRLRNLIEYINIYDQKFLQLIYPSETGDVGVVGSFYPWAGFTISAIAIDIFSTDSVNALIVPLILACFYTYLFLVFLVSKILKIPHIPIIFILVSAVNIFPIGLVFANNFALIYGILGAITLIVFLILSNLLLSSGQHLILFILSPLFLVPLHPSSIFTFYILLFSGILLFSPISLKYYLNLFFFYSDSIAKRLRFSMVLIIGSLLGTLIILNLGSKKINVSFLDIFILLQNSLGQLNKIILYPLHNLYTAAPTYFPLDDFLKNTNLFGVIFDYIWKYIFMLSYWNFYIPVSLVIFLIIVYSKIVLRKNFYYLLPIFVYLFLILSSSVSGLDSLIRLVSLLTVPFYQSPLRISHIGVLVYTLYLGLYLKEKRYKS